MGIILRLPSQRGFGVDILKFHRQGRVSAGSERHDDDSAGGHDL